jgi:hypothetical protein
MISGKLVVWQINENRLIEKLPDGSTAVFDTLTKTVHSINETAAAAFESCRDRRTVAQVATAMQEILKAPVTEEMALEAIAELQQAGLVACSEPLPIKQGQASRRSLLKAVGTVAATAAPLVLSLSMAEQSVYAQGAGSGTTTSTTTTSTTTTTTTTSTTTTTTTTTAAPGVRLSAIAPNAIQGCNVTNGVIITGVGTHFSSSSVVSFSSAFTTASNVVANSATSLALTITGPNIGTSETVTVTVTTGSEVAVGTNILSFTPCS